MLRRLAFATLATIFLLGASSSARAEDDRWRWEGSQAEEITAKGVDALIIRPLATVRVAVGAALMLPACLLASPSGREGIDGAYEILLEEPMEYAFTREMGEF